MLFCWKVYFFLTIHFCLSPSTFIYRLYIFVCKLSFNLLNVCFFLNVHSWDGGGCWVGQWEWRWVTKNTFRLLFTRRHLNRASWRFVMEWCKSLCIKKGIYYCLFSPFYHFSSIKNFSQNFFIWNDFWGFLLQCFSSLRFPISCSYSWKCMYNCPTTAIPRSSLSASDINR